MRCAPLAPHRTSFVHPPTALLHPTFTTPNPPHFGHLSTVSRLGLLFVCVSGSGRGPALKHFLHRPTRPFGSSGSGVVGSGRIARGVRMGGRRSSQQGADPEVAVALLDRQDEEPVAKRSTLLTVCPFI